jgi:hypothetical protein
LEELVDIPNSGEYEPDSNDEEEDSQEFDSDHDDDDFNLYNDDDFEVEAYNSEQDSDRYPETQLQHGQDGQPDY